MKIAMTSQSIGSISATLTNENPEVVKAFYDILPVEGRATLWGDEIYFSIPMETVQAENPRVAVKEGEIAIWIENPSLCIFFGKTPVSTETEIRAYSEVAVIGNVDGGANVFKKVKNGEKITITK